MPIRLTVSEFAGAAPAIVSVAVRFPPCWGAKVTLMVQVARAPIVPAQVFAWLNSLGSVPPNITVNGTLEVESFVTVIGIAALFSVISVPLKVQVSGEPEQSTDDELTVSTGVTLSIPITEVVPVVAVTVTGVELFTGPAVII